ncbi:MAG: hypothetical protein FJ403_01705 [Verrucomicrobia bacterium]|nr:hypothetical protein [Verrucomicrobiota bacterium]
MQVNSSSASKLTSTLSSLSLQSTRQREKVEALGTAPQNQEEPIEGEAGSLSLPPQTNPDMDRKLSNLGRVQYAFSTALKISNYIESAYLFDPIV